MGVPITQSLRNKDDAVANRTQIKNCTISKQSTCLKKTIKLKIRSETGEDHITKKKKK